ncbi:hypothetical protein GQU62_001350 [Salmonella enterica]|nr:hypothetical protein [Salmonella enterica subsp. enterica serovar Worthington]EDT5866270.1 hypothetical protein [Salmonella enterica subsp. enterica serovar Johannesburg]EDU7581617.1 hypothetical protein [Salmonella enterica subsp. enterica serovar Ohio]EDV6331401.1 hypothetical protein [Salmonella enterica subsp. enterica serovar London]EDY3929443.1 hypothetical protein [Salmonella enterica]EEX4896046.1 hypothetical protein [Salmonella enterica subsp. enterica serovar Brandenburg]
MSMLQKFLSSSPEIRKKVVQDLPLPPHNATSCQYNMWYLIQLLMTLYVVSSP